MRNIYHALLLLIAGATEKELVRQLQYLKEENRVLRSRLPTRVLVTPQERNQLVRFARGLGKVLDELVTIVHPSTLRRWIRESRVTKLAKPAGPGRKPTAIDIQKLIVKLARENGWGYTRILGELRKLGVGRIARNTVKNILKVNGLDLGPKRGKGTWDEFLKLHADSLWQSDFFSVRSLTKKGFRDLFVLVFLHVKTRTVFVTPATANPNEEWVCTQATSFVDHVKQTGLKCEIVMHDRDTKFTARFDDLLKGSGIKIHKSSIRAPNMCAFVERFIQTIKHECLDYFIVFGERHLNYLCTTFTEFYHRHRPHQGKENKLLSEASPKRKRRKRVRERTPPDVIKLREIRCEKKLGGLLNHYYRKAA